MRHKIVIEILIALKIFQDTKEMKPDVYITRLILLL